jgi:hypothetical protein
VRDLLPDDIVAVIVGKRRALTAEFGELVSDLRGAATAIGSARSSA